MAVVTVPTHGTATATGNGITYTPITGYYGPDSFTYMATNATGSSAAATVTLSVSAPVVAVTPSTLASGTDGNPYAQTIAASGGQAPYTFATSVASGALPPGLALATNGLLSGTPTAAGSFSFTVTGTDSSTGSGPSTFTSSALSLMITAVLPGAPIAGVATAGDMQATVAFNPPASLGGDAVSRNQKLRPQGVGGDPPVTYIATSSPGGITGSSTASPILVTGLTNGTPYTFTIAASNTAGTGPQSAPTNAVTPQGPQTITFTNPGPQGFGTGPTLTATASSGLAVAFTSTTTSVCTITGGGTLSFILAGTCTINANQPGNAAFLAASQVSQSFAVAATVPGAPTMLAASAGNGQSTISFTAPASNGGSMITVYTVTSSPGGITASSSGSPILLSGLTNGTSYTFTITASNSAGTGPGSAPSNAVTPSASVTATQAVAAVSLTQNHAATAFTPVLGGSGVAPLLYSVSPVLPSGLALSTATGLVSGTPTVSSPASTYAITVSDAASATATATFSMIVNVAVTSLPGVAPQSVTAGVPVTPFTPITGAGGSAPLTYTISPALPAALTIDPATGQITGTPSAGSPATVYTVTITDANGASSTATFTLAVNAPLVAASKAITAAYNSSGTTSTTIDLTSAISGGTPTSITVTSAPVHGSTAVIGLVVTYTPAQGYYGADSFTYTAAAGGVSSNDATVSITISAPTITTSSSMLADGAIGVTYNQTLAPLGGVAPYIFSSTVTSGTLPAGLTLSSNGMISGTPTAACTCTFTITGTDSSTPPVSFSLTLSLTVVAGEPTVTAVSPDLGLAAGGTSVTITGTNFTDTSVVSFGATPASSVIFVNATTLAVLVPPGTGTVDTIVTTIAGSSPAVPADTFTYLAQPSALTNPLGTAVDGSGNTFIVDPTLGYIVELPTGCTSVACETIIGSGLTGLTGVTVDSNGNLVVLSGGSAGVITELNYDAATNSYGGQTTIGTGLNLPSASPTGIAVDDAGNLFITDTADHTVVEEPYNASTGTYGAPITLTTGSAQSTPTGITVDGNGDVFYADPGTGTIAELLPGSSVPIVLVSGINAQAVTIDASGDVYYTDPGTNTVTKIPFDGASYGTPGVIATGLSGPLGISVDDHGDLFVANNGTKSLIKVTLYAPPSFNFASTRAGATSTDSPQTATLANIGSTALTFPPIAATNPSVTSGYVLTAASTCPELSSTAAGQTVAEGGTCSYVISFSPEDANVGPDNGSLTPTDDNLNVSGATQTIALTGVAVADDTSTINLTLNPASPIVFGQAVAITAAVHDATVPATVPTGSVTLTSTVAATVETTVAAAVPLTGGSAIVPVYKPAAAGSYTLTANYRGATGTIAASTGTISLVVTRATPNLVYKPLPATQVYGNAIHAGSLNATATDANGAAIPGAFVYTTSVNGTPTTLTAGASILAAGTYAITATFTPADSANYVAGGSIAASYVVTDFIASVSLSSLSYSYNGQAHSATVTTSPANLAVTVSYGGSAIPPTGGGSYPVIATISDPNYSGTATGTLVIARVPVDSVTFSSSPNPVLTTTPITVTGIVSSSLGTPTGTVNFTNVPSGTVFATAVLANGIATFVSSAEPLGVYDNVAVYLGDANFLPATSPVFETTILDFSVGISTSDGSAATATTEPGGTADYQFTLTPDGSSIFTDPVTFTISGQPAGSTYTLTPSTIPAGSGPTPVALAITVPQTTAMLHHDTRKLATFALALLLLPFASRMRKTGKQMARLLALVVLLAMGVGLTGGLTSCGAASGFSGGSPGGPKTYTIILTGMSGKLKHSTTVTLTVP